MRRRFAPAASTRRLGSVLAAEPMAPLIVGACAFVMLGASVSIAAGVVVPRPVAAITRTSGIARLADPASTDPASTDPAPDRAPATASETTMPSTPTASPSAPSASPPPAPTAPARNDTEGVTRIRIQRIGVDAPIIDLGLEDNGSLEVPTGFTETGWWSGGPEPGTRGPAIIVGHISSRRGPAVFYDLDKLVPGDTVDVDFADDHTETFQVQWSARYDKDAFPTNLVYGATEGSTLRLITCGGTVDPTTGHFDANDVVFLNHVDRRPT